SVVPTYGVQVPDYYGSITNLRGDIAVNAGAIGGLAPNLGGATFTSYDPRAVDPNVFKRSMKTPGPIFTPGDGTISITTRGDLVFGGAGDAGMADPVDQNQTPYTVRNADGTTSLVASGGQSRFTLWTPSTAIGLYAAGGDVAALDGNPASGVGSVAFYPGTLIAAAANGDIRFSEPGGTALSFAPIELAPSPFGQLALLAAGSIYGSSQVVAMSGADMSTLATPFHPVFNTTNASNASPTAPNRLTNGIPIAFGPDTPLTNLHAGDNQPALVYAGVDIVQGMQPQTNLGFLPSPTTWYTAAKPFQIVAGRDIVGTGPTPDAIFNNPDLAFANAGDNSGYVSIIKAGRDIIYQSVTVAGSGLLDVQAGRNLYQGYYGMLQSMYGFTGSSADALTFFLGLSSEQQSIFVRQIYFAELTAGGREETGALASPRLGSYLRGREAIAALFPSTDAQGKPIAYGGDITMFSGIAPNGTGGTYLANAGIHTDFGGDIQILNPGGKTIIGVEGVAPGASAGLITQGSGNIDVYSLGSVLLGQSRIMTTFGGDIIVWSATGDINAGR
ncbi:hypothetical protein ADUPG1_001332, partial [Aduncisulcus paluster]